MRRIPFPVLIALCMLAAIPAWLSAEPDKDQGVAVDIQKNGDTVIIEVGMLLPVEPHEAWEVLTDYNHMTRFLHNVEISRIIGGSGNTIQVEQKGRVRFGLLSFPFDTVREVELKPFYEIHSHVVHGNVKRGESVTRLVADRIGTRLLYHNETESTTWLPAGIGPAILKGEVRSQFLDMKNEILRRKSEKRSGGSAPRN